MHPSERFYLFARVAYSFCWMLIVTIHLVFLVEVVGLDPLQMILVGTVLEAAVFLFEIPTGVVADVISRKLSVVIGHGIMGLGFGLVILMPTFTGALISSAIWGFGWTFISGAYPAWLTSEIGVADANAAFLKGSQFAHGAAFVGIAASVALAPISLSLPIGVGSAGLIVLSVCMAVFMQEDNFKRTDNTVSATVQAASTTLLGGVAYLRSHRVLLLMLAITAVYGLYSEGVDRLFTPFLIESYQFPSLGSFDSVTWWGVIAAVASIFGLLATTLARKFVKLSDQLRLTFTLSLCMLWIVIGVLLFANIHGFWFVLACYWLVGAARSAYGPLMTAWLNRLFPEDARATLFSVYGQADAVGQVVGGPIVGIIAQRYSIALALSASALLLLPAVALYRLIAKTAASNVSVISNSS